MSDKFNTAEKIVEEFLIDVMTKRVISEREMSTSIQASLMRGVQASSSTTRGARPSRPSVEKRTKHRDDLENAKMILTILPNYIPPLAGVVIRDRCAKIF